MEYKYIIGVLIVCVLIVLIVVSYESMTFGPLNQDRTQLFLDQGGCLRDLTPQHYPLPPNNQLRKVSRGSREANNVCSRNFSSEMRQNTTDDYLNIYDVDVWNMFPYKGSNPIYPLQKSPKSCSRKEANEWYRCADNSKLCGEGMCDCMNECILKNGNRRMCYNECCRK